MPTKKQELTRLRNVKLCINCKFRGEPCGYTNNVGGGRQVMYSCPHSSVRIYDRTLACELYQRA